MIVDSIRNLLYEPKVRGVNVDDNELLGIHADILRTKPLLRSAFETFYNDMSSLCDKYFRVNGLEVELGSGAGFYKSMRPELITSDIRKGPSVDMELNALNMSLDDASVRCIYAINVFHHLPHPEKFFEELDRVLLPGGGCILVEPHGGVASATLHRYLHTDEHFDPMAPGWSTADIGGPLSGANQALADIVFRRDLEKFTDMFGSQFEIAYRGYELNALRYLLSGGLNFRQLVPSFMARPLILLELLGRRLARYWSLHQVIVIRKRT